MSYIFLAILAYLISAVVSITDKFLVSKGMKDPVAYSFYVGILSIFVVILIPFGFSVPPFKILAIALASGGVFLLSLLFLFAVLFKGEASRVVVAVGGLTPVFTLILGWKILGEALNSNQFIVFLLLLGGSFLICMESKKSGMNFKVKDFTFVLISAFLLSLSYVLAKVVYINQPFISGFIWTRLGSFIAALFFLLIPNVRKKIFKADDRTKEKTDVLFVANKALAGAYFILLNFSISKGNVAIVNALRGVEYVFVFLIAVLLSKKFPSIVREKINKKILMQKIAAILIIGVGLILL